ncbi:Na(+)-linked D-alanine glycine permease [hydrothermal vent metagenome]|uniref:Na(+)-linked D-alanine glycine permease n=1 Tax=hydrothermal vent metagenome TaxID=652676 RepID=A0A3B1E0S5_9ZZZZ
MEHLNSFIETLNGILFSNFTVYALLATGVVFTIWSVFGQARALTHGFAVIRGKYDDKNDPGAINHFQALSAALSATVGLGNIGGVAVAVALGGPGAILWMWVIGIVGMALKMTEVTQAMLYRNTEDPDNPHGGPMFVVKKGLAESPMLGVVAGLVFAALTLFLSFLAYKAFGTWLAFLPGLLLASVFCILGFVRNATLGTFIGGVFVVTLIISAITGGNMFQAWNVGDITYTYFEFPQVGTGIILAVLVGLVIIGGIKRIGAVAGRIVPLMCCIYVLAAAYVLANHLGDIPSYIALIFKSGLPSFLGGEAPDATGAFLGGTFGYAAMWGIKRALFSSEAGQGSSPIAHSAAKTDEPVREGVVAGLEPFIDTIVVCTLTALVILSSGAYNREAEATYLVPEQVRIVAADEAATPPTWTLETGTLPDMTADARRIRRTAEGAAGWRNGETVFLIVEADIDTNTGRDLRRITGTVSRGDDDVWSVKWKTLASEIKPFFRTGPDGEPDVGIYGDYAGASMTAYAFDRTAPGLGKVVVTIAAWLFAISTMISWSYYGEQGVYYLFGFLGEKRAKPIVLLYKLTYCLLIFLTGVAAMKIFPSADGSKIAIIGTDSELDMWTTLGLGVMLVVNIPIMLIFGSKAMKAYHGYVGKLKAGEFHPHAAPDIAEVIEGHDHDPES